MRLEAYREHLQEQNVPDGAIEKRMAIVEDFARFLMALGSEDAIANAGKEDVERFAQPLVAEGRNTLENLTSLRDYAHWLGYRNCTSL
jgi:hypothetical protein